MSPEIRKSAGPGRPKDLEKRAAILAAAKHLFLEHGFEGTSMDMIAASAGVSKLTVYSHFQDKERLFSEAVRSKCTDQVPEELFLADIRGPIREQLLAIAKAFFALINTDEAIALQRLLSSSAGNNPRLAQMFWEAGPQTLQQGFAGFLQREVEAGQLVIGDVTRAASQFFCLLKGELHARQLCGCTLTLTQADIDAHLRETVDFFLRGYGAKAPA